MTQLDPGRVHTIYATQWAAADVLAYEGDRFREYLVKQAAMEVSMLIFQTASVHTVIKAEDLDPIKHPIECARFGGQLGEVHHWRVGVVSPTDTEAFSKQLDQAYTDGMQEAAAIVNRIAILHGAVPSHHCGAVIERSLRDAAAEISLAATKRRTP